MESGNSGSLQSSSGGDDEYDSRSHESISAFLNSSSTTHIGALTNPGQHSQLPPPSSSSHSHHHHHHHQQNPNHRTSSLFDPLSNYFDVFSRSTPPPNPNSPLNLDMVWSRSLRSEPNSTDVGALMGSSSSSSQQIMGAHQNVNRVPLQNPPSSTMSLHQGGADHTTRVSASSSDQTNVVGRQSKKRSRASRRAPTTVLTTDTSNFRAMVQEFTGIPAPPFSASPFPRSRLDLFNTASTVRSGHLEQTRPPPYLLRPFAHKVQPPPFVSSSSSSSSMSLGGSNTNTNSSTGNNNNMNMNMNMNMNTSNPTSTNNYQLLSELGLSKQSQNLVNMQNPLLTFQSLLQSTIQTKYPPPHSSNFGENSQAQAQAQALVSNTTMGTLDDFNVHHGHVRTHMNELQNFVTTSDGMLMRTDHNIAPNCEDGVGTSGGDQGNLRSFNENYGSNTQQSVNTCKINYTAGGGSSSHDKGSENATSRGGGGEGMVDSWICSSD